MSGQAKRSRVRAAIIDRVQVARMIALATEPECERLFCNACRGTGHAERFEDDCDVCNGTGRRAEVLYRAIMNGQTFDVHAARAYAKRLIAEGQRAAETWAVFIDWTRERGLGPESWEARTCLVNRRPHHVSVAVVPSSGGTATLVPSGITLSGTEGVSVGYLADAEHERGGWPGHLAAEWARGPGRVKCYHCDGSGLFAGRLTHLSDARDPTEAAARGPCPNCNATGLVEGPRPQPGDAALTLNA